MVARPRSDRPRGQSAVIGFVLMFGLVMLLLTILQTTAVPTWNQGEEFDHSQQVRGELELLRDDIASTAETGRVNSESITLGTRYPRRPFLINPADPSGRIETTAEANVILENVVASGEASDYWTGDNRTFTTRHLVYRPNYNEYRNAPTTVYENSVLYDRFEDEQFPLTSETLISDQRITLVTLNGSLSEASTTSTDIELQPVSAPEQVTTVEGDGPVRLHLPTRMTEETWTELLKDEFVPEGNVYENVTVTEKVNSPYDRVTITLRGDQTYNLRMAEVGLGSNLADYDAHYLTTDSDSEVRLPAGSSERVTFEVRDRYNNPVSGEPVTATVFNDTGTGRVVPVDNVSDADGLVTFRYTSVTPGDTTINATFGSAGELETATVAVEATPVGGAGGADTQGPAVTIETNRTTGPGQTVSQSGGLTLNATVSDFGRGGNDIYDAVWFSNRTAPGDNGGSGFTLEPDSGDVDEFDSVEETVTASGLKLGSWDAGWHQITVRARDAAGNPGTETFRLFVDRGSASEETTYLDGTATAVNSRKQFTFDVDTGESTVTLQNVSIDTTQLGGARDQLSDLLLNGTEIRTSGGRNYVSDGTVQSVTPTDITGRKTLLFGNFKNGPGNSELPAGPYSSQQTAPTGDHMRVTLGFADGSSKTLYFVPP